MPTLKEALKNATYIQECAPENLELKKSVFRELEAALDAVGNTKAILGSSSSTLMVSEFTEGLRIKDRALVTHPVGTDVFVVMEF